MRTLIATDHIAPQGIVDLRGHTDSDVCLSYPHDAVVIVAGLPGSGKSTLLHAWAAAATVVDPRATRTTYETLMPPWLPYVVYQPWARLKHMQWIRTEIRRAYPLLVHDCGSRPWMRRWLAYNADRARRPLHMVVLDVGSQEALSGQHARRRLTSRRVFATHQRGLARLLSGIERNGLTAATRLTSMVLLDRSSRDRSPWAQFSRQPPRAGRHPVASPLTGRDRWMSGE
ncbi:AAA family ATPase [Streptomyces sp. NPDC046685]|uniref:AAA family ATPase n=1 Tax=Streptomyces sp. NPDC046685 TaxID=3157202 RepID=UPI0033F9CB28